MTTKPKKGSFFFIICLIVSQITHAKEAYWQCIAEDTTKKQWVGFAGFKKTAYQKALDSCKKYSILPQSCTQAETPCLAPFEASKQVKIGGIPSGFWICTALDRNGDTWGGSHADRIKASLAARAYCRDKSSIPHTCYINTVTCRRRGL